MYVLDLYKLHLTNFECIKPTIIPKTLKMDILLHMLPQLKN